MSDALADSTREIAHDSKAYVVVLPLGAFEQHGPHLPLGTDSLIVEAVAARAVRLANRKVPLFKRAPVLPYGRSGDHRAFSGLASVESLTYVSLLRELVVSLATSGFDRIFVLNGHGANDAPMRTVLPDAARDARATLGGISYWTASREALQRRGLLGRFARVPGHAGLFETSLVLALAPQLVSKSPDIVEAEARANDAVDPSARVVYVRHGEWSSGAGITDRPGGASAGLGARSLAVVARAVADVLLDFEARSAG